MLITGYERKNEHRSKHIRRLYMVYIMRLTNMVILMSKYCHFGLRVGQ